MQLMKFTVEVVGYRSLKFAVAKSGKNVSPHCFGDCVLLMTGLETLAHPLSSAVLKVDESPARPRSPGSRPDSTPDRTRSSMTAVAPTRRTASDDTVAARGAVPLGVTPSYPVEEQLLVLKTKTRFTPNSAILIIHALQTSLDGITRSSDFLKNLLRKILRRTFIDLKGKGHLKLTILTIELMCAYLKNCLANILLYFKRKGKIVLRSCIIFQ